MKKGINVSGGIVRTYQNIIIMDAEKTIDLAEQIVSRSIKRTERCLQGYMEIKKLLIDKETVEKREIMDIITRTLDELK